MWSPSVKDGKPPSLWKAFGCPTEAVGYGCPQKTVRNSVTPPGEAVVPEAGDAGVIHDYKRFFHPVVHQWVRWIHQYWKRSSRRDGCSGGGQYLGSRKCQFGFV
jgi:hypothetical protein